mmetsp:Transcript_30724/g.47110  ORF Transcript_30724/g.47110 Transcript_30724/m.47110 type:complete len:222 (-) Transcript_30724:949-1614(-)
MVDVDLDEASELVVHDLHEQIHEYLLDLVLVALDAFRHSLPEVNSQLDITVLNIRFQHLGHFIDGLLHVRALVERTELVLRNELDLLEVTDSILQLLDIVGAIFANGLALVDDEGVHLLETHFTGSGVLLDLMHEQVSNLVHLSLGVGNLLVHDDGRHISNNEQLVGATGDSHVNLVQSHILGDFVQHAVDWIFWIIIAFTLFRHELEDSSTLVIHHKVPD